MRSSLNGILSVLLSICIVFGAVIYVSAQMPNRNEALREEAAADESTVELTLPYASHSEPVLGINTPDLSEGLTQHEKNTREAELGNKASDASGKDALTADSAESVTADSVASEVVNPVIENGSPVKNSSASSNTEQNAVFDDFEYKKVFYTANDSASYILSVSGRGQIRVQMKHIKLSAGGFSAKLYMRYSPNGDNQSFDWRLINVLETKSDGGVFKTPEIGVSTGVYKVVVTCLDSSVPDSGYYIKFMYSARTDFETECNDTITRYNEIFAGRTVYGSASRLSDGKDCDWFMYRAYGREAVTLTFDHPVKDMATVCWKITVYNDSGDEIYSDNSYFSTQSRRSGRLGIEAGCYFIKIENRVYYDETYSLTIRRYTDILYESETNDTEKTADTVAFGKPIIGELSERFSGIDVDLYKISVTKPGYCLFTFSHEPDPEEVKRVQDGGVPKNGWRITVTASSGEVLYGAVSSWNEESVISPFIGLGTGEYYVRIDSKDLYHNSTPYTLNVGYSVNSSWETEPNGTYTSADILKESVPLGATMSSTETGFDTDWFVFAVSKKSIASVCLEHALGTDSANIFMFEICDSSLNRIALTDNKGQHLTDSAMRPVYSVPSFRNQQKSYAYSVLEPGKYYVRVKPGAKYDPMKYTLTLSFTEVTQ